MDSRILANRLRYIDKRLEELRTEYKDAPMGKRKFIVTGAELLKVEREQLEKKIEMLD